MITSINTKKVNVILLSQLQLFVHSSSSKHLSSQLSDQSKQNKTKNELKGFDYHDPYSLGVHFQSSKITSVVG